MAFPPRSRPTRVSDVGGVIRARTGFLHVHREPVNPLCATKTNEFKANLRERNGYNANATTRRSVNSR